MSEENEFELVDGASALESISRAEIDMQIATAKKYPRNLSAVKRSMLEFATLDQETAESCFYSLPRGGTKILGPSVRLAEIALSCFGNMRSGTRVMSVHTGENPHVVVQSVSHDLEKNTAISLEKRRRIVGKKKAQGKIDEDDINLAVNACASIALRDSLFRVIPLALIKPVFEAAKKVAVGDQKTLAERRERCLVTFEKMGLLRERVLSGIKRKYVEEITLEDLESLFGIKNAITDGTMSIDDAFPLAGGVEEMTEAPDDIPMGDTPAKPKEPEQTPNDKLATLITDAGMTFDDFMAWEKAKAMQIPKPDDVGSFDDIPANIAKRLAKVKLLVEQVRDFKEGGAA